jgi:hypothetical protein
MPSGTPGIAPAKLIWICRFDLRKYMERYLNRAKKISILDINVNALTRLALVLTEGGHKIHGTETCPGQIQIVELVSQAFSVNPGRADIFKWFGCSSTFRDVRAFN